MELGKHLVQELGLENSNNTLGRWIAHHLAELMFKVKNTKDIRLKKSSEQRIVDLILKIWSMRDILPADANPLRRYDEVLKGIRQLFPGRNPWQQLRGSQRQQTAANLYRTFNKLIIGILLLDLPSDSDELFVKTNRVDIFLSPTEQQMVLDLKRMLLDVQSPVTRTNPRVVSKPNPTTIPVRVRQLIDETHTALDDLEKLVPLESKSSPTVDVATGTSTAPAFAKPSMRARKKQTRVKPGKP